MVDHHIADHAAQVPAGEDIVADVGDTVVGQVLGRDAQDGVAHVGRDPAVDPVADDVVEALDPEVEGGDVALLDAHVTEIQGGDAGLTIAHVAVGEVDTAEAAAGEPQRQRDEVAARGAAELQHAALRHGRCAEPEQGGERGQARRLRLRERLGDVRDEIVVAAGCDRRGWVGHESSRPLHGQSLLQPCHAD